AALAMLMTLTYGGIVTFLPLFGREAGIAGAGRIVSADAGMWRHVRHVAGGVIGRSGYVVIAGGGVFGGIGLPLIGGGRTQGDLVVAALFYGVAFGVIQPALQAWAVSLAAPERRGRPTRCIFLPLTSASAAAPSSSAPSPPRRLSSHVPGAGRSLCPVHPSRRPRAKASPTARTSPAPSVTTT
ncbi:hypothetical protein AB1398_08150, partial [Hydrogenibacillus schlegelii]